MFRRFFVYPCFAFFLVFVSAFSKHKNTKNIFIVSLGLFLCFLALVCLKEKSKNILLCLLLLCLFLLCLACLKNRKPQKYLLFLFGFVSSLQGSAVLSGVWFHVIIQVT